MIHVVVTGAAGFIGRNLLVHLKRREDVHVETITRADTKEHISRKLQGCHIVYHLAGVNRPLSEEEFKTGNTDLTGFLLETLSSQKSTAHFVMSSTTQATLDNAYGKSKRAAEELVAGYAGKGDTTGIIFRLPGVFGKWSRPDYNSVVSTFCYNIARDLPIQVNAPDALLKLVYIDDVIASFISLLDENLPPGYFGFRDVPVVYTVKLGELADMIRSMRELRGNFFLPDVGDGFQKKLYSTYLTYLPEKEFSYPLLLRSDNRGSLFELVKSHKMGQIFISSTHPGITRGNHFHHTKTEKFCVISGTAMVRFRKIETVEEDINEVITYEVDGASPTVIDIPPGYAHNITNTGTTELITLFWANEVFDPERPDTFAENI